MKRWERVAFAERCGLCGTTMNVNDIAVYIKLANVKRELTRCTDCGGQAPPDLPPLIVRHQTTKPMTPIQKTAEQVAHKFGGKIWKHG